MEAAPLPRDKKGWRGGCHREVPWPGFTRSKLPSRLCIRPGLRLRRGWWVVGASRLEGPRALPTMLGLPLPARRASDVVAWLPGLC